MGADKKKHGFSTKILHSRYFRKCIPAPLTFLRHTVSKLKFSSFSCYCKVITKFLFMHAKAQKLERLLKIFLFNRLIQQF